MADDQLEAVAQLWEEHLKAVFPTRWHGLSSGKVDLVTLDADIGGCVTTWLENFGRLDASRQRVIRTRIADLDRMRTGLDDASELAYCDRLRAMAIAISRR